MERKIIGLLGKKHSGKDTAGEYMINDLGFKRYAFGDPVKEICKHLFNLSEEQLTNPDCKETIDERWGLAPRQMFQRIGTEFGQINLFKLFPELKGKVGYSEMWCKLFELWLEKNPKSDIIITDVRFKHEIECIKRLGGLIVKINRDTGKNDSHISECNIDSIPKEKIDFTIDNNYKLEDLYSQLDTIFYVPF